jgi:hypothetical protein
MGLSSCVKILRTCRDVEDIAASMVARGNKEKYKGQFVKLAERYNSVLDMQLGSVGWLDMPMSVKFNGLMRKTDKVCHKLSEYLGVPITNECGAIDPSIPRTAI